MIETTAIIVLTIVCIALTIERYFYSRDMNAKTTELLNAILSRNMNEFISAKAVDKIKPQEYKESDEVPLDVADDEAFNKFVKNNQ